MSTLLLSESGAKPSGGMTVGAAFQNVLTDLEITEAESTEASTQNKRVREELERRLNLKGTFLTGSYRRNTLKRPLTDIDVFAVLDDSYQQGAAPLTAAGITGALDLVEAAIARSFPNAERRRHERGIQLQFARRGIGFDIIPAYQPTTDEFRIPDASLRVWIRTNPKEQQILVSAANQGSCGQMLVPLIKLVKVWNDVARKPLRGFHLEAMAYHALSFAPATYAEGLNWLFGALSVSVLSATPDIWPYGEPADQYLTAERRSAAAALLSAAAADARQAITLESIGDVTGAHRHWRKLLGPLYPAGEANDGGELLSPQRAVAAIRSGERVTATSAGLVSSAPSLVGARSATSHGR